MKRIDKDPVPIMLTLMEVGEEREIINRAFSIIGFFII